MQTQHILPEWYPQEAVLMAWPHAETDWAYMLTEVQHCFITIAKAIIAEGEHMVIVGQDLDQCRAQLGKEYNQDMVQFVDMPTNDTWARDFGPISVIDSGGVKLLDYTFNAWGLKFASQYDNLICRNLLHRGVFRAPLIGNYDFVLEGGSIEYDDNGTLMVTSECLLSPNRNAQLNKEEIEVRLKSDFGVKQVLWLSSGGIIGDDTDSHIDTLARFAPNNTILYVGCDDEKDPNYTSLKEMELELSTFKNVQGEPYHLIRLPHLLVRDMDELLPATYANFLITNNQVLVPTYASTACDSLALKKIQEAFPKHKVVGIDCRALIKQHGSLHCMTMQIPVNSLNL